MKVVSFEVLRMCRKGFKELKCNIIIVLNVSLLTVSEKIVKYFTWWGLFSMLIAGVSEISVLVLFSSSNFSWLFIVGSALLFRALTSCG